MNNSTWLVSFLLLALGALGMSAPANATLMGQIVVANRGSGSISVIDVATNTVETHPLPAGANVAEPMYVVYSPDNEVVFVGDRGNDRVVAFDARDFSVVNPSIPTGNGVFHMWGDPLQNQLWVNNDNDQSITVIDMLTFTPLTTFSTPADLSDFRPHDVVLDPNGPFAYVTMVDVVSNLDPDFVLKYSTNTFMELDRAEVGDDPHVSLSQGNNLLFVTAQNGGAMNSGLVHVLDRDMLAEVDTIDVPSAHGAGMSADGQRFYTTNITGGASTACS